MLIIFLSIEFSFPSFPLLFFSYSPIISSPLYHYSYLSSISFSWSSPFIPLFFPPPFPILPSSLPPYLPPSPSLSLSPTFLQWADKSVFRGHCEKWGPLLIWWRKESKWSEIRRVEGATGPPICLLSWGPMANVNKRRINHGGGGRGGEGRMGGRRQDDVRETEAVLGCSYLRKDWKKIEKRYTEMDEKCIEKKSENGNTTQLE